ncbi:MAG: hypothetical protein L3J47_05905 [Sulfurovum sp.]|nr:hypothetical protein [Sulfurovum sp.]
MRTYSIWIFLLITAGVLFLSILQENTTREADLNPLISAYLDTSCTKTLETERRGCCSHHHGVCGCSPGGRQVCCDGTLSPTCTCRSN